MPDTVIVGGAVAQRPARAGHAWVVLNWLTSFRQLGYDVVFVDRFDDSMGDQATGIDWVATVMASVGVAWSVALADGSTAGLPRRELIDRCRGGVLLNIMGYVDDQEVMAAVSRRVFLDIDPGFGQAWQAAGLATLFDHHDAYVSVGLNIGRPGCGVPDLGLDWVTTVPPVDLQRWVTSPPPRRGRFTTVASWRGPFAPVEVGATLHGLRVHDARAYATLPQRCDVPMEMALDIGPADDRDRLALLDGGWTLRDPLNVAGTLDGYRQYVQSSLAELSVAKQAYRTLRTGWFSDRSACYLASGRPVVVSDTGLDGHLPLGEGLLTFDGPDSAAAAVAEVLGSGELHSKAARELAETHLDGRIVAQHLLERVT